MTKFFGTLVIAFLICQCKHTPKTDSVSFIKSDGQAIEKSSEQIREWCKTGFQDLKSHVGDKNKNLAPEELILYLLRTHPKSAKEFLLKAGPIQNCSAIFWIFERSKEWKKDTIPLRNSVVFNLIKDTISQSGRIAEESVKKTEFEKLGTLLSSAAQLYPQATAIRDSYRKESPQKFTEHAIGIYLKRLVEFIEFLHSNNGFDLFIRKSLASIASSLDEPKALSQFVNDFVIKGVAIIDFPKGMILDSDFSLYDINHSSVRDLKDYTKIHGSFYLNWWYPAGAFPFDDYLSIYASEVGIIGLTDKHWGLDKHDSTQKIYRNLSNSHVFPCHRFSFRLLSA